MKKKSIIFLALIFILFFFTPLNYEIDNEKSSINEVFIIDNSSIYNYTESNIVIDATATTNTSYSGNWTWIETNYDWCSGSGVWGDSYLINNVSFSGGIGKHGLEIRNSRNSYFEIKNCKSNSSSTNYAGFYLKSVSNGTIYDNTLLSNFFGIYLSESSNCTLLNNNISSNSQIGLYIKSTQNCTISGNNIVNNENVGLYLENSLNCTFSFNVFIYSPLLISSSFNNEIDITNIMDGKSIYYYEGKVGSIFNNLIDGVLILVNCSDSLISNLTISQVPVAVFLYSCKNTTIENLNISYCSHYGILLLESYNCTLVQNDVSYNDNSGFSIFGSDNTTINQNNISYNGNSGVELIDSFYNSIMDNNISYNGQYGFYSYALRESIFKGNYVSNNDVGLSLLTALSNNFSLNIISNNDYGISFDQYSQNNIIWLNYIDNNTLGQAFDNSLSNLWSYGELGNYWSDYTDKYPEAQNIRGLWNIPYIITGNSYLIDRYPLVDYPPVILSPPKPFIIVFVVVGILTMGILGLIFKNKIIHRRRLISKNNLSQ